MTQKVRWRNRVFDVRTARQLIEAERLVGFKIRPNQGSYSRGPYSAGTHSGGGAVDIDVTNLSKTQRIRLVKAMRTVGFAAWLRTPSDGFSYHIHGISNGAPDLPGIARRQVESLKKGRNGLASNKRDPHAGLGVKVTTWEEYLKTKARRRSTWPLTGKRKFGNRPAVRGPVKFTLRQQDPNIVKINKKLLGSTSSKFTALTARAVKRKQQELGLRVTGIVDRETWDGIGL